MKTQLINLLILTFLFGLTRSEKEKREISDGQPVEVDEEVKVGSF